METSQTVQREIQELTRDLMREDELGAVIRVHIRVEQLLIQTIECLLPHPQQLAKLNLDYDGRVTLALALGLKEQFGPPFRAFGKLRNDFAHKLDTSITRQAVNNLYGSLGSEEKTQVQATFQRIKNDNPETRHVERFTDLEPADQFKLIAVSLWAMLRAAVNNLHKRAAAVGA